MTAKSIIAWKVTLAGFFGGKCDWAKSLSATLGLICFRERVGSGSVRQFKSDRRSRVWLRNRDCVRFYLMSATNEKLETLFGKVRSLPKERQEAAIEALADIASEPYELSASELAVLKPALERAGRGEWASDAEVSELLDKTWR
jgi:hypothetical protein